mgnify:CR=1 FL=1
MGSIFTTGTKIKDGNGKDLGQQIYLQFVPGIVVDVVSSDVSLRSGLTHGNTRFTNSIIAKPHYTEGIRPKVWNLGDDYRYFPLLRGITDSITKGDPVLLCTFGGIQYYLGPLNSSNDVNFNADPMWSGEGVTVQKKRHDKIGTPITLSTLQNLESENFVKESYVRLQKIPRESLDRYFDSNRDNPEEDNFSINETHTDMVLEGRHGNSIRIGSRRVDPYIFISNGRNSMQSQESLVDGSIISMTSYGSLKQHFSDYQDPITEEIITGFQFSSDLPHQSSRNIKNIRKISSIMQSLETDMFASDNAESDAYDAGFDIHSNPLENYRGNQIMIRSDRLVFDAKIDNIFISSRKNLYLGSGGNVSITTNEDLIINSRYTFIGNPTPNNTSREMEPMVLGNQLKDILKDILKLFKEVRTITQGGPMPLIDQKKVPLSESKLLVKPIEDKINIFLSNFHYIEPNDTQK